MIKKIKSIELVFENCEVARINSSDIHHLDINGLEMHGLSLEDGAQLLKAQCTDCFILLKNSADRTYNSLGTKSKWTLFDRIMRYADIVFIEVHYTDNVCLRIAVPWSDTEEINNFQKVFCGSDCLSVKIEPPKPDGGTL